MYDELTLGPDSCLTSAIRSVCGPHPSVQQQRHLQMPRAHNNRDQNYLQEDNDNAQRLEIAIVECTSELKTCYGDA